jgi:hypothetical protein
MSDNIYKVQIIAQALGEIKEQVVFVGGSVVELYADNPELSDVRSTIDVDCVMDLQISTYLDYCKLEEQLRDLGFQNDTRKDAPICRKIYKKIIVDFMPVNQNILGFSNLWYKDGIINKIAIDLPDKTSIFILPVEYYLATKFEAMCNRGGTDIRGSHDWEDIVYVLDNCEKFLQNLQQCNNTRLIDYLKEKFSVLLKDKNIKEIIYTALPYNSAEEHIDKILNIIEKSFKQ